MPKCADAPFTLDKSLPIMALLTGSHPLWISKYPVSTDVPSTLFHDGGWVSVTRTDEELSVLATKEALAAAGMGTPESGDCGGPFTSLRVKGPLEHYMVGVQAEIARVLKDAKIAILTISTWNTEYILVTTNDLEAAKAALEEEGWKFA